MKCQNTKVIPRVVVRRTMRRTEMNLVNRTRERTDARTRTTGRGTDSCVLKPGIYTHSLSLSLSLFLSLSLALCLPIYMLPPLDMARYKHELGNIF
jgi:hypothetical protein